MSALHSSPSYSRKASGEFANFFAPPSILTFFCSNSCLTLFSLYSKIGWRLGLQFVACLVLLSFFIAFLYRPASLYHPQRRAILHLKNSRKKVRFLFFHFTSFILFLLSLSLEPQLNIHLIDDASPFFWIFEIYRL